MFSDTLSIKSLGSLLQRADLVSASQIETALRDQTQSKKMKIGEILASRGWIKQETADFFAERWNSLLNQESKQPLGYYLKEAALLNDNQIQIILFQQRQKELELRFGTLAVLNGWLKATTLDFFLNYFYPERPANLQQNYSLQDGNDKSANSLDVVRENLTSNEQCDSIELLRLYQQILLGERVSFSGSHEQTELIRLGLIVNENNQLKVANKIYRAVFNPCWVDQELICLDPYNQIKLKFLKLNEKAILPYKLLREILKWTGNQPYLVQKLVQVINQSEFFIAAGEEATQIEKLVRTHLIENWETKVAAEHLQQLRDSLLHNEKCSFSDLANVYQKILSEGKILYEYSQEESELINLGLVVKEKGKLKIANRIYQEVFNPEWLANQLERKADSSVIATSDIEETPVVTLLEKEKDSANITWTLTSAISTTNTDIEEQPILSIEATKISEQDERQDKSKKKWIILGLVLLGASLVGVKLLTPSREAKIFQEGNELFVQGIHQEAIAKYNQVLKIDANYYQAWTNRGYAFAGLKDYEKMLDSCTSATIIFPEAVYAWNCQGEALYNLQQYDQAIATFDRAIALKPEDALFWMNKAESLLALKEKDQALTVSEQAITLLNSDQAIPDRDKNHKLSIAYNLKGRALRQKEEYAKALEAYDQALKHDPDYYTSWRDRSIVLHKLKRTDEAVAQFQQILSEQNLSSNQKAETWYYLGLSLIDLSRDQEAIAAFAQALELKPDYQAAVEAQNAVLKGTDQALNLEFKVSKKSSEMELKQEE